MPTYSPGDFVKVEFPDETTGIGEWMWVRVHHCHDDEKLVLRESSTTFRIDSQHERSIWPASTADDKKAASVG